MLHEVMCELLLGILVNGEEPAVFWLWNVQLGDIERGFGDGRSSVGGDSTGEGRVDGEAETGGGR